MYHPSHAQALRGARRIGGLQGVVNSRRRGLGTVAAGPRDGGRLPVLRAGDSLSMGVPAGPGNGRGVLFKAVSQRLRAAEACNESLPMEVIGLCRFSYPALGGFQRFHETPQARARYLYDPERLEERFRLFQAITLPCLRAQTDQDFTFLVVIGDDFPQRKRLEALLAELPQAVIRAYPPGQHREVMAGAITEIRQPGHRFSLQFRLDDDDGVGRRFVERLRATVHEARPIFERNRHAVIDFNRGHVARLSHQGIRALPVHRSFWTPGLGMVLREDCKQTVMNFEHGKLWKIMPSINLPAGNMFIRGLNDHNDSSVHVDAPLPLLDSRQEAAFFEAYGVSADQVRTVYRIQPDR